MSLRGMSKCKVQGHASVSCNVFVLCVIFVCRYAPKEDKHFHWRTKKAKYSAKFTDLTQRNESLHLGR